MRRQSGYAVLAAMMVLAGCGGSRRSAPTVRAATAVPEQSQPTATARVSTVTTATTPAVSPPTTATTTTAPPPAPRSDDCEALGMTRQKMREGPCTHRGLAVYVANRGTLVRLRELSVRLNGFGIRPTQAGQVDALFSLTVGNRLRRRVAFDARSDEAVLDIGSHTYMEDRAFENAPSVSFAWKNAGVDPGKVQTGTIAFRIPRSLVARLSRSANLVVAQFTDEGARTPRRRVAILRTYH